MRTHLARSLWKQRLWEAFSLHWPMFLAQHDLYPRTRVSIWGSCCASRELDRFNADWFSHTLQTRLVRDSRPSYRGIAVKRIRRLHSYTDWSCDFSLLRLSGGPPVICVSIS